MRILSATRSRKPGRRAFLGLLAVAPVGPALSAAATGVAIQDALGGIHSSLDPWVEIRGDHLRHNVQAIGQRVGGRPILAVIKNNAYGLGIVQAGRLLEPLDAIGGLAVVKLHEAVTLRDAGIRKPVLLMGPVDERGLEEAVARAITPMVYTPVGPSLDRIARRIGRPVGLHVCIDTGMGRVGVPYREADALIRHLAGRDSVRIEGVMTTLSEDEALDREQLRRLESLADRFRREGVDLGRTHAASSFALFERPDAFLDMVRPGMAIYGVYPEPRFRELGVLDLRPAISLKARVAYVKQLQPGDSAGYGRAYVADRSVWIATLPVGHVDGLPRAAASGGSVRIGDAQYPIIAAISASHCMVELGATTQVRAGDEAVFFDWRESSRPEELALSFGGSVYDLTMHLNPLLPRREV